MKILNSLFLAIVLVVFIAGQAFCAPKGNNGKENKGKANDNAGNNQQGQQQQNQGQGQNKQNKSQVQGQNEQNKSQQNKKNASSNVVQARVKNSQKNVISQKNQTQTRVDHAKNKKSNNTDQGNLKNQASSNNRRGNHIERIKETSARTKNVIDSLTKSRWAHNPNDDRGQGNMGKPEMISPFGFDKDSGRQKWERSRIMHNKTDEPQVPLLDLSQTVNIDWAESADVTNYLNLIDMYTSFLERDDLSSSLILYYNMRIDSYQSLVEYYSGLSYARIDLKTDQTVNYSLNLILPEGMDSRNLLVSTQLVATEDINEYTDVYDPVTGILTEELTGHMDQGEVLFTQEEEVLFMSDASGEYNFSLDPPEELLTDVESGNFDLLVTVTDIDTNTTYTQTYDKSIYVYRDPYGKVTDSITGEVLVGAKVTVYDEAGAIVSLDKASNPSASNPQMTDATGRYAFNLATDRKYYLVSRAEGYEDYKSPLFTEQWHVIREDIKMVPIKITISRF